MSSSVPISCPFCGYTADGEYMIMYHIEEDHAEGDSPFIAKDASAVSTQKSAWNSTDNGAQIDPERSDYLDCAYCPIDHCGEVVILSDLEAHLELHAAESSQQTEMPQTNSQANLAAVSAENHEGAADSSTSRVSEASPSVTLSKQETAKRRWRALFNRSDLPGPGNNRNSSNGHHPRLGSKAVALLSKSGLSRFQTSGLGPHAHEVQMPERVRRILEADGLPVYDTQLDRQGKILKQISVQNRGTGIIQVLEQLLQQNASTKYAYTCHPTVVHISKLKGEGGFCGYRNIQMLCSYIIGAKSQGYENFSHQVPNIFQLQEFIEGAWDKGINSQGRIETGGIRGTRKYIGTSEAQAMFLSLEIPCRAHSVKHEDTQPAFELLFQKVKAYFRAGCPENFSKMRRAMLAPLYLQQPGHSITVVGFEKSIDGTENLLVFDPMFHDNPEILKYAGQQFIYKTPSNLLIPYRRGAKYFRRHNEFEYLRLSSTPISH